LKNGITLLVADHGLGYFVVHDDDRYCFIPTDGDVPHLALAFGWSPCSRCPNTCRGATDGTRNCPHCTGNVHRQHAIDWLNAQDGDWIAAEPGYFAPVSPSLNHDMVRALYVLAASYYHGQWSRGYRLLCRVKRYADRHGINLSVKTRVSQQLLRRLVKRYAHQL